MIFISHYPIHVVILSKLLLIKKIHISCRLLSLIENYNYSHCYCGHIETIPLVKVIIIPHEFRMFRLKRFCIISTWNYATSIHCTHLKWHQHSPSINVYTVCLQKWRHSANYCAEILKEDLREFHLTMIPEIPPITYMRISEELIKFWCRTPNA